MRTSPSNLYAHDYFVEKVVKKMPDFIILNLSVVDLKSLFPMYKKVIQFCTHTCTHTHTHTHIFFTIMVYYEVSNIAPCARYRRTEPCDLSILYILSCLC